MTEIEKIKTKIFHLLNRTIENGCTEAEAMFAAAKAGELLDTYNLSLSDIQFKQTNCVQKQVVTDKKNRSNLDRCLVGLAKFCDTKLWFSRNRLAPSSYHIFGLESDCEMFEYLYKVISNCLAYELNKFKVSDYYKMLKVRGHKKVASAAFIKGFCSRINERLGELKKQRQENLYREIERTGRNLVLVKSQKVDEEFNAMNLKLTKVYRRVVIRDYNALKAGSEAANKVHLNTAVDGNHAIGALTHG